MKRVEMTRGMRPMRAGQTRIVPDAVAERLVSDGTARNSRDWPAKPSGAESSPAPAAGDVSTKQTYKTRRSWARLMSPTVYFACSGRGVAAFQRRRRVRSYLARRHQRRAEYHRLCIRSLVAQEDRAGIKDGQPLQQSRLPGSKPTMKKFGAFRGPYPWQVPPSSLCLQLKYWPVTSPVSCAGIRPPRAPKLSLVAGSAAVATRYFVRLTYLVDDLETAASIEESLYVPAGYALSVSPPPRDPVNKATGWNCYIGTASFAGTLQNVEPLAFASPFVLPGTGLIAGAATPGYMLVSENRLVPDMLAEGLDFPR